MVDNIFKSYSIPQAEHIAVIKNAGETGLQFLESSTQIEQERCNTMGVSLQH